MSYCGCRRNSLSARGRREAQHGACRRDGPMEVGPPDERLRLLAIAARSPARCLPPGWAEKENAPVPIQGQMRENTSAVPPCLTDQSPPTSFECRHTRSPLTLAVRRAILMEPPPRSARPRRSICRFAATRVSANALDLCACAAGLISASTVYISVAQAVRHVNHTHVFLMYFPGGISPFQAPC